MVVLSCYCCGSSLLRNSIALYELWWFFPVIFQKNCQEKIRRICHSLRRQKIFSLCLSNSSFSWWKWINMKIKIKNQGNQTPCHSSFSGVDHLWSTSGIICGSGSFAVRSSLWIISGRLSRRFRAANLKFMSVPKEYKWWNRELTLKCKFKC